MSLRESLESTLPEVARVVHILSQTAEAIPTSVAPPRSWRRAGGRACKDAMGRILRCGCGSACLEGARVRDCGARGRVEEEHGRDRRKAAVVLLLLKALVPVLAATTMRRSSTEAWTRFMVFRRGGVYLLASRKEARCCC